MSNPLDYIQKYPERTKRILGISYRQWQQLSVHAIAEQQVQQNMLEKKFGLMRLEEEENQF